MTDIIINKKITFISKIILISFLLIALKVWILAIVQKEKRSKDAINPQRRVVIQKAPRGIICDRLGAPLAINRTKYNATIYYSHIKELPNIKYDKASNGKKIKRYPRREYIKKLSSMLGNILEMDPNRIEDLIHSKASLLPHIPFVIKENISEKTYYKLKMLQKDYVGLFAESCQERYYPMQEVGSNLLGYMGQISQKEYFKIATEIKNLQNIIEKYENKESINDFETYQTIDEVKNRLNELKNLSYNITDMVGKSGVEKKFDEKLKGFHKKRTYAVDIKGNFLKEIEGFEKPKSGKELNLSISSNLQKFAENLLIENEKIRNGHSRFYNVSKKEMEILDQPWIKGGSIVVMDPTNGEILALASNPRFNSNDFITSNNTDIKLKKLKNVNKWLETSNFISKIYDGKEKLFKEHLSFSEEKELTYDYFIDLIVSKESGIKKALEKIQNIKNAIELQENVESLFYFSKSKSITCLFDAIYSSNNSCENPEILKNLKENEFYLKPLENRVKDLLSSIPDTQDKIFTVDLCRTFVFNCSFSDELIQKVGKMSLNDYWNISKATLRIKDFLKANLKKVYHEKFFSSWREENEKIFLKSKRIEENEKKLYPKPYIDLLDEFENEKFTEFWQNNSSIFVSFLLNKVVYDPNLEIYLHLINHLNIDSIKDDLDFVNNNLKNLDPTLLLSFIKTIRSFNELDRPLLGEYFKVRKSKNHQLEKHLAASFYPINGFGYTRQNTIASSSPPGSLFKILIAYSALIERYNSLEKKESLNPFTMIDDFYWDANYKKEGSLIVGKTIEGKPIPRIYKNGRLPKSSHSGIGKIDLIQALEKSSNPYFSILASDHIKKPESLFEICKNLGIGTKTEIDLPFEIMGFLPEDILTNKTSLYSFAIGQHTLIVTPMQMASVLSTLANKGNILKPKLLKSEETIIKRKINLPDEVRNMILEGLDRVVSSDSGNARAEIINYLKQNPKLFDEYKNSKHQFVGKTSTAEFMFNPYINPSSKAMKYKNIWFGAISFETSLNNETKKQIWEKPELVVVVELNFGLSGKEAAPLAYQVIQKYRELKAKKEI